MSNNALAVALLVYNGAMVVVPIFAAVHTRNANWLWMWCVTLLLMASYSSDKEKGD